MDSESQDVTAVIERLRKQDIDVVRVSYSDMIGIDRGRDVLLSELPAALGHGLPFSRCVYVETLSRELFLEKPPEWLFVINYKNLYHPVLSRGNGG